MAKATMQVTVKLERLPEFKRLVKALIAIRDLDLPATGRTWPDSDEPMSYSACYGSNGVREYMRDIARQALAGLGGDDGGNSDGS